MSIEKDKVVSIAYTLKDESGEVLDSNSESNEGLEFVVGKGNIIVGLEDALLNKTKGDKVDVEVAPKDGYGEYDADAKETLPREQFAGLELEDGMTLYGQGEYGETVQVTVTDIKDDEVTVDYNHPLAGKELFFNVEILDVRDATEEELKAGFAGATGGGCCGGSKHEEQGGCCGGSHHGESSSDGCCSDKS
jgi:FKBP-type peptidyl-prolyl cis-trans isomerase SlyD